MTSTVLKVRNFTKFRTNTGNTILTEEILNYRASKWHYRQRNSFVGNNSPFRSRYRRRQKLFRNYFSWQMQRAVLCSLEGGSIADENYFGHNLQITADTDTDTDQYYF